MAKHPCFDEPNRQCLLQVVALINNLESLSNDEHDLSMDNKNCNTSIVSLPVSWENEHRKVFTFRHSFRKLPILQKKTAEVDPSSQHVKLCLTPSQATSTPIKMQPPCADDLMAAGHKLAVVQKLSSSHSFSSSMNESGVFDGDLAPVLIHQSTQTDSDAFGAAAGGPNKRTNNSDLYAEIQKLNTIRRKMEQCSTSPSIDIGLLGPLSKLDETRLQYYRDRLELLENKVAIYESSDDDREKHLQRRLQNEIRLAAQVKQLNQRIEKIEAINRQLDEERCELEEIENDTRLQLQRLEVDLEMLSQRNSELEMSHETAQAKIDCVQGALNQSHEQIIALEMDRNDLLLKWELINAFMPALLLFNVWKYQQHQQRAIAQAGEFGDFGYDCIGRDRLAHHTGQPQPTSCACNKEHICPDSERFNEMVRREQELADSIAEMNRAYNETLERADNLWAQMEREYKEKLNRSQEDNQLLRSKIGQLETRLKSDAHYAQERIAQLEEEENMLKRRLSKLNRISRDDADKYKSLHTDFQSLSGEYERLKAYADGPLTETMEKERKKVRSMEEEMRMAAKMYSDLEQLHRNQMNLMKAKFDKCRKDLVAAEANNSELKEEVVQLEHRIIELNRCRREDEDRLQTLAAEAQEQQMRAPIRPMRVKHNSRNLAQELGTFGRNANGLNAINNLNYTSVYTLNSVAAKIADSHKSFEVSLADDFGGVCCEI